MCFTCLIRQRWCSSNPRKWCSGNPLQLLAGFLSILSLGSFPLRTQLSCSEKPSNMERPHTDAGVFSQQFQLSLWLTAIINCLPGSEPLWVTSLAEPPSACSHVRHQIRTIQLIPVCCTVRDDSVVLSAYVF